MCFLIITPKNPVTSTMFIDRFLASTLAYQIDTTIVFNKIDNYDDESKETANKLKDIYINAGYNVISVSAKKKVNIDILKKP